jgi:hypothetical protein
MGQSFSAKAGHSLAATVGRDSGGHNSFISGILPLLSRKEKRRIDARKDEGDYGDSRDAEAVSAGTE